MKWLERLVAAQVVIVALLLGIWWWRGTVAGLTWALTHGDHERREAAAVALGRMGPKAGSALPALVGAISDPDDRIQIEAATAVGSIGGVEALAFAMKSPDVRVRRRAAEALRSRPDRIAALPTLRDALHDPSALVRRTAIEALGAPVPRSADLDRELGELVRSDPDVEVATAAVYATGTPPDPKILRLATQSPHWRVRHLAMERLAESDMLSLAELLAI